MADETKEKNPIKLVGKHEFYFETPLYEEIAIERIDDEDLDNLFEGDVDAYSAKNGIDTTYEIVARQVDSGSSYSYGFDDFKKIRLTCKRKYDDVLYFFVYVGNESIVKVGQLPSLADLQFAEIGKKYDKHLGREDLQEFKKAIGLAAHGVGAGSFVYLRRIFEKLIDETYGQNAANISQEKEEFLKLRMDDKVDALKDCLPPQLVSMKRVYSILSAGVHNLSEQQCLTLFPALKLSIELILEQKIEREAIKKRDAEAQRQIVAIEQSLRVEQNLKNS